ADRPERGLGPGHRARPGADHRGSGRFLWRAAGERGDDGAADGRQGEGMRRLGALVLLLGGVACAPGRPMQGAAEAADRGARGADARWIDVQKVQVEPTASGRRVTLALNRSPEGVHDLVVSEPPRLVIDLAGARPAEPKAVQTFPLIDE